MTSFWRNNDVTITSCIRWDRGSKSRTSRGSTYWCLNRTATAVCKLYKIHSFIHHSFIIIYLGLFIRFDRNLSVSNEWRLSVVTLLLAIRPNAASRLFTQPFIQAQIEKKTSKVRVIGLVRGIHRWPVNSPHKGPVTRKMFPFDDVFMKGTHIIGN